MDVPLVATNVLKIPFDDGGGEKSFGARFGPDAIEQVYKEFPWRCSEGGKHPGSVEFMDIARRLERLHCTPALCATEWFSGYLAFCGKSCFVLSGDNSWSYNTVFEVASRHPNPYLILLDAHPDVASTEDHDPHATWVRRLWEQKVLLPSRTLFIGIRDAEGQEREYCHAVGARVLPAYAIRQESMQPFLMRLIQEPFFDGQSPIVTVVDIDVLDPVYAPGTGVRRSAGLSTRQLLEIIYFVGGIRASFKAGEITEVIPAKGDDMRPADQKRPDPTGITVLSAADILREMICSFS